MRILRDARANLPLIVRPQEDHAPVRLHGPEDQALGQEVRDLLGREVHDREDGAIYFGHAHLTTSDRATVYLDILHELVHVKQLTEGRDLYDTRYPYVDRPTEIEAYALVVEEARLLGMSERDVAGYLYVEWASREDHRRLCRRLGVDVDGGSPPESE